MALVLHALAKFVVPLSYFSCEQTYTYEESKKKKYNNNNKSYKR